MRDNGFNIGGLAIWDGIGRIDGNDQFEAEAMEIAPLKTKILIIEDDNNLQKDMAALIEASFENTEIDVVYALHEARYQMESQKYDLIISGLYEYEHVEGKAFEKILELSKDPYIPVIFISSSAQPYDTFIAAKLGAYDFIKINRRNLSAPVFLSSVEAALKMRYAPKVFISYSSADRKFVKRLAESLQAGGVRVWWDTWEIKIGDSITKKIEEGIASSSFLILVLSPASVSSRWVNEELDAALIRQISDRDIHILPVLKDDCSIPLLLRSRKYADFRKGFKTAFGSLYKAITTINVK